MDDDVRDTQAGQEQYPAGERNEQNEAESAARRHAALRALAQRQTQQQTDAAPPAEAPSASRASNARATDGRAVSDHRFRRSAILSGVMMAVAVMFVLVVAVAGYVGARGPQPLPTAPAPPAAKPVVRINPLGDGLLCVQQLAWSPDSAQLAVLGNTDRCGASSEGEQSTGISIYDARTGKLTLQLQPDLSVFGSSAVQEAITKSESNPYNTPELSYTTLVWTPDGKALLLPYSIQTSGPNDKVATFVTGLLRLGIRGSSLTSLWLDTTHPQQSGVPERWDLTTGTPVTLPPPGPASAYYWMSDDSLSTDNAQIGAAIGNPTGGQRFSVWQPGYLQYHLVPNTDPTKPGTPELNDILWQPAIMSLSPDGRYFYTYFSDLIAPSMSLTPPSTTHADPSEAAIAPHDKALLALAQQMTQFTGTVYPETGYAVAWRPDGKRMAAVSLNVNVAQPATAPSALTVSIYDTASGQVIKQFTPDWTGLSRGDASRETVMWSPDGARLLLQDNVFGEITIWGPGALPA